MNELEQIFAMLGVQTFAEATAALARVQSFTADAKASTGKQASGEALQDARVQMAFAKSVEAALGVSGPAALGKIEALKESSALVAGLEADAKAAKKSVEDRDAKELIDQATAGGKLRPAAREKAEGFYAQYGLAGLRSFVETLPDGAAPSTAVLTQVAPSAGGSSSVLTAEEREIAKAMGKSDEEMISARKSWDSTKGANFSG